MIKIKYTKAVLGISFLFLATACSVSNFQKKGDIENPKFHHSIQFITKKSVIIIPAKIDGETKNFLFDTGADASLIQRDSIKGKTSIISGASKRKMELGNEIIASIEIESVNFRNTVAWTGNLVGLKEQIPNFGGIIGQPVISKANWLINYPDKTLTFSDKNLIDDTFTPIKINRKDGSPFTYIKLNGKTYKAIIDLGSSSSLSIPKDTKLADELLKNYPFTENEREVYTLGGLQTIVEKIGTIPRVQLGNIEFENVDINILHTSQIRLGNRFFKDCILYIDNINKDFKIKK